MQISNCLVIIKQTALAQGGRAASFAHKGDETAKRLLQADGEHKRVVGAVRRALKSRKIAFAESSIVRFNGALKRQLAGADFVISVGGDGTLLRASHYVRDGMMIGVNSAPGDSVGHFCTANRENFADRLDAILNLKWHPVELTRLRVTLDGRFYVDGARAQYPFPFGTRVRIEIAQESLKLFL